MYDVKHMPKTLAGVLVCGAWAVGREAVEEQTAFRKCALLSFVSARDAAWRAPTGFWDLLCEGVWAGRGGACLD